MKTELLYCITPRPKVDQDSLLLPGDRNRLQAQYVGVVLYANHWTECSVSLLVVEDVGMVMGDGTPKSPYTPVDARLWGQQSPSARWEVMDNLDSCRVVSIAMSLVRDEISGEARNRAIYDMIVAAMLKSAPIHKWVNSRWPGLASVIKPPKE